MFLSDLRLITTDFAIKFQMSFCNPFDCKHPCHFFSCQNPELITSLIVFQHPGNTLCQIDRIKRPGKIAVLFMVYQIGHSTLVESNAWGAASHGFHGSVPEAFLERWQDKYVCCSIELRKSDIVVLPSQVMCLEAEVRRRVRF